MRSAGWLLAALAALLGAPEAQALAPRAMWTWESATYELLRQPAATDPFIAFAHAHGISTVYLYADRYHDHNLIVERPELYRHLIQELRAAGIATYALLGSADLHTEAYVLPEHRAEARAMLDRVIAYNADSRPEERFAGLNIDIEPYILDAWATDRSALLNDYLDLSADLMERVRASRQSLLVGPALPFWWDDLEVEWHGRRAPMAEHVLGLYDYAALMDYRNHADGRDGLLSLARGTLDLAARLHRPIVLGVEIADNAIPKITFHPLAPADLERELARAEAALAKDPAFAGFAIHHYSAYRDWLKVDRPRPPK